MHTNMLFQRPQQSKTSSGRKSYSAATAFTVTSQIAIKNNRMNTIGILNIYIKFISLKFQHFDVNKVAKSIQQAINVSTPGYTK